MKKKERREERKKTNLVRGESAEGKSSSLLERLVLGDSKEHVRVNDGVGSEGTVVLVLSPGLV